MKPSVLITLILCGTALLFIPLLAALARVEISDNYAIICVLSGSLVLIASLFAAFNTPHRDEAPTPITRNF